MKAETSARPPKFEGPDGRITLLTPDLHDKIVRAVRAGNYYNAAAAAFGVNADTLNRWLTKGRQSVTTAPDNPDCPTCDAKGSDPCHSASGRKMHGYHSRRPRLVEEGDVYYRFAQALKRAENENEAELVASWKSQARTDWRAAKELLARRHHETWGDRTRHELSGQITQQVDVTDLSARIGKLLSQDEPSEGENPHGSEAWGDDD